MVKNSGSKIFWYGFLLFLLTLFQVSCQKNDEFIGYNDLLDNSPMLLWGSSIGELKNNYPNVEEYGDYKNFIEFEFKSQLYTKFFRFYNNQLFMVGVGYGNYSNDELDLLKKELQKHFGTFFIEDNGTIESWYVEYNENNNIVFVINKIQNNAVNCSYIYPPLRDEADKNIVMD